MKYASVWTLNKQKTLQIPGFNNDAAILYTLFSTVVFLAGLLCGMHFLLSFM